ncbi:MAG: hypothetical protein JXB03_03100 [Spirochaetales bacterium]|nr:hypothetical protein [Spirochaetales bacterium]
MKRTGIRNMSGLLRFIAADVKQLSRMPGMLFFLTIPLLMWSGLGIIVPFANRLTVSNAGIDLLGYTEYGYSFLVLVPGMIGGMMIALLLVDDRDLGLIRYFGVLPFGKTGYLAGRTSIVFIISWVLTLVFMVLPGFYTFNALQLIVVPPMAALGAPFIAFIGAGIAKNKVAVMAVLKTLSGLYVIPLAQFFIPSGCRMLLGVFPPYWVTRMFLITGQPVVDYADVWISIGIGVVGHGLYVYAALRFFQSREN